MPSNARVCHAIDSSSFGTAATIRVGEHGENDATLFFRSPEQLERLAEEATRAVKDMRQAILLRSQLQSAVEVEMG